MPGHLIAGVCVVQEMLGLNLILTLIEIFQQNLAHWISLLEVGLLAREQGDVLDVNEIRSLLRTRLLLLIALLQEDVIVDRQVRQEAPQAFEI